MLMVRLATGDIMSKIWFTSDLHFGHEKEFLYGPRGYSSNEEMMQDIVRKWNNKVAVEDEVYILGDIIVGEDAKAWPYLQQLNGKLHLIWGNHDTNRRLTDCYIKLPNIVSIQPAARFKYDKYHFWLSHYPTLCSNYDADEPLKCKVINLCGHIHTKDAFADWNKGLIYHCELDAHNNEPVCIEDIIENIKLKMSENQES